MVYIFLLVIIAINLYLLYRALEGTEIYKKINDLLFGKKVDKNKSAGEDENSETADDYIKKYEEYIGLQNSDEALLVAESGFKKFPDKYILFENYIDCLVKQTNTNEDISKRKEIVNSCYDAIKNYSVNLKAKDFDIITPYIEKIKKLEYKVKLFEESSKEGKLKELKNINEDALLKLAQIQKKIENSEDENLISSLMDNASDNENKLSIELLDKNQKEKYDELKNNFEELANKKGQIIRLKKYKDYNEKTINSLKKLLDIFSENEKKYSDKESEFPMILKKYIGNINTNYLNPETLTYMNFVYGYIFENVDDDSKYIITKIMNDTEKDII
jgi:hypothetical protein